MMEKREITQADNIYNIVFKRILDIIFSLLLCVMLSPVILLSILINCFFTRFHPIFCQKRCGKNKKPFIIFKLRTLKLDTPNYEEKCNQSDYTKIGFFLRKTHIDELLQLLNIFIGQMSFIGPRPVILSLNEQIDKRVEDGTIKLRPGLSGLAQVNERDKELTKMEKCSFDKEYLNKISFKFDFILFFKSIGVIFVNLTRKRPKKCLTLMYITNNPEIALIAEKAGVDRIWIDLETLGKEERQHNLNTVKSHHSVNDIMTIKPLLTTSSMLVRVNPWNSNSKREIDEVIEAGADLVMLPMWKTSFEVKCFLNTVGKRAKTILLLETKEAVECLDEVLCLDGIDEIHIGLNDLHLSYGLKFMFELLSNGLVEDLMNKILRKGIPCGFGGISHLGDGLIPAELIITEHYRLGSTRAILSRGFCNLQNPIPSIEADFLTNMKELRLFEKKIAKMHKKDYEQNRIDLCARVKAIVGD